jgi:hypothetical protein
MYHFHLIFGKKEKLFILDPILMPHEVVVLTITASLQTSPLSSIFSFKRLNSQFFLSLQVR